MMRSHSPLVDADSLLVCPHCRKTCTHVDQVFVAARHEDGGFNEIAVDAVTGTVTSNGHGAAPVGEMREARRHRIALVGSCEMCGQRFGLAFTQHKGETIVEWAEDVIGDAYPEIPGLA